MTITTPDEAISAWAARWSDARHEDEQRKLIWDRPSALAQELFPGYRSAPHLKPIDDAYIDALNGKVDRIVISLPPQVGKSTTAAEAGPLWWLHVRPRARVTVASYAAKLATDRGEKVRDTIITSSRRLNLELTAGSRAAAEWDLVSGGGMKCMGVGGGLTGFGSDLMIVDDPHKDREEANSGTIRRKVWGWYQSTVESRMAPGAPLILIMTRWHEDDLTARVLANEGRVEDGGRWRVISIPAIAEGKDAKDNAIIDPLGRAPGDPLTNPKLPGADRATLLEFWTQKRRSSGPREWPALYQQRPAPPEGAVWKFDWINLARREVPDVPPTLKRIVAVDPSGTAKQTSDECGIVVVGRSHDGHGWVLDDRSKIATPAEWGRTVCQAAIDWDCTEIVAEQNQGYEMVQDVLKNAWAKIEDPRAQHLVRPRVVKAHSRIGKVLRAEPIAAVYERLEVHHVGDALDELEDQMTGWTGDGDSPDRVDALVHGLTYLLKGAPGPARSRSVAGQVLPQTTSR